MKVLKLVRTLKSGMQNFFRNGWLSLATISVIVLTLFIINIQIADLFSNTYRLLYAKDKVSISVYFKQDVSEADVVQVRDEFSKYKEIQSIEYISKEKALEEFKEKNKENETIRKSIEEIGGNPLGATLNIKANDSNEYELIAKMVEDSKYKTIISKVNYHKYRDAIDGLNKEIQSNRRMALLSGIILSAVAILITFNSIRITMYAHQQEIEIMRLVGASNIYIRFPFIWEGILYGIFAVIIAIPLSYIYLNILANDAASTSVMSLSNAMFVKKFLTEQVLSNIFIVALFQFILGIFLGVISSMIAIRRYLNV